MPGDDRLVEIYLQDHLAGSVAALELVSRSARSNDSNELGAFLRGLHTEIGRDKAALLDVMEALGAEPSRVKNGLAWAVEKAGRLKLNGRLQLNGRLLRYSPLSRLVELELLEAGIVAKRSLWTNLVSLADPRLAGVDLPRLVERAEAQRAEVETWRRRAAAAL